MSFSSFIAKVEADIDSVWHKVEGDAEVVFTTIWNAAKPLFMAFEPTLIAQAMTGIATFLVRAEADIVGGELPDILQAFLEWIQTEEGALYADAKTLGEDVLSLLIGLAKAKTP